MAASKISTAEGKRVFVIGDIHGCPDETALLLRNLHEQQGVNDDDVVIFLGDFIDRGPDSRAAVEAVLDFKWKHPRSRFLRGNHEDMLLDFLGFGGRHGSAYLQKGNGGIETLESYGVSPFDPPEQILASLPPAHFKFFCDLESIILVDKFICVHAGLNPLRDLDAQNDLDVFWIREEFIYNVHAFDKMIVFGHTPNPEVYLHTPWKVGLDTGLVFGGKLTCLELLTGHLLQIRRGKSEVEEFRIDLGL